MKERRLKTTFVLVHGAWHGAWCFELLIPELERRGHAAVAMDMPCEDGSATFETYAQVVLDAMATMAGEQTVLVGHSLGGMTIPIVAAKRPVRAIVSLCWLIPKAGGNPWQDGPPMERPGTWDPLVSNADGSKSWPDVDSVSRTFYPDCSVEAATWAFERLRPQNSMGLWAHDYPLTTLPDVPWHSIARRDDEVITVDWARYAAQTRLGIDVVEMPGGHSPFLASPGQLADLLVSL